MKSDRAHRTQEQQEHLRQLLRSLGKFRGAKAEFVLRYNDQTGKNYAKNLVNKILNEEINFSRNDELDVAVAIAEKLSLDYGYQRSGGALHALEQDADIVQRPLIGEIVELADSMFARGQNLSAYELLTKLLARVDMRKLYRQDAFLFAYFHLVFAKVKMQGGIIKGGQSALQHIQQSYQIIEDSKEFEHLRAATSIKGHVYRQLGNTHEAKKAFEDITRLADMFDFQKRMDVMHNTEHQLSLTLAQKHQQLDNPDSPFLEQALTLMQRSNSYFANQEHQAGWYRFARIREVELLLNKGETEQAGQIIEEFSDMSNLLLLDVAKQVIVLRLRSIWLLQKGEQQAAAKDFQTAHQLAEQNQFFRELMSLKRVYFQYPLLRQQLPESMYDRF